MNGIPWRDKGGMRISTARSCGQRLRAGSRRSAAHTGAAVPTADGGAVKGDGSAAGNNEALAGRGNPSPALWRVTQQQHLSRALALPVQVLLAPSGERGGVWRVLAAAATSCDVKADLSVSTVPSRALQPSGPTDRPNSRPHQSQVHCCTFLLPSKEKAAEKKTWAFSLFPDPFTSFQRQRR